MPPRPSARRRPLRFGQKACRDCDRPVAHEAHDSNWSWLVRRGYRDAEILGLLPRCTICLSILLRRLTKKPC